MFCIREAKLEDIHLISSIMITSFRTAFADFVSGETMDSCTNPDNCYEMLKQIYISGKMRFLIGDDKGFICWQESEKEAEIVALHSLPESWGTGLGNAMLTQALAQIESGTVFLWAFEKNLRARRFYEKHGFRFADVRRISEFDGTVEMRYEK